MENLNSFICKFRMCTFMKNKLLQSKGLIYEEEIKSFINKFNQCNFRPFTDEYKRVRLISVIKLR